MADKLRFMVESCGLHPLGLHNVQLLVSWLGDMNIPLLFAPLHVSRNGRFVDA